MYTCMYVLTVDMYAYRGYICMMYTCMDVLYGISSVLCYPHTQYCAFVHTYFIVFVMNVHTGVCGIL